MIAKATALLKPPGAKAASELYSLKRVSFYGRPDIFCFVRESCGVTQAGIISPGEDGIMRQWDNMVDFQRIYKVLRVAAEAVLRDAPESFNMGFSAQDLAHETFSSFLDSSNGL